MGTGSSNTIGREVAVAVLAFLTLMLLATIPLVSFGIAPLVPLPLCAVFLRQGIGGGMAALGVALLVLMLAFPPAEQLYALPFACTGALLGIAALRWKTAYATIAVTTVGLTLLLAGLFHGYNFHAAGTEGLQTSAEIIDRIYDPERIMSAMKNKSDDPASRAVDDAFAALTGEPVDAVLAQGEGSEIYDRWIDRNEQHKKLLLRVNTFPAALIFVGAFLYVVVTYAAGRWLLPRRGAMLPRLENFRTWRVSWGFSWLPLAAFAAYAASRYSMHATAEFVSHSVLMMALVPYMALAFAVAAYWIKRMEFDPLLTAVIYTFVILNVQEMAVIAIFDSWVDFRRLDRPQEPPPEKREDAPWDDDVGF